MRLPIDSVPPVAVPEDRYRIHQPEAIQPARAVAPHASFSQVYYRKRKQEQAAGEQESAAEEGTAERRSGDDRRLEARRAAEQTVILDTRTGLDRRTGPRREGDIGSHIDEVA